MGRWRLTRIGAILMLLLALGVLAVLLGGHNLQAAGFVVIGLVLLFLAVGGMGWLPGDFRAGAVRSSSLQDQPAPTPDYIPAATTPSEEDWARERADYRDKGARDGER